MIEIRYLHNNIFRNLQSNTDEIIGVYSKGDMAYLPWMGFIELAHLNMFGEEVVPVRLAVGGYRLKNSNQWIDIKHPNYMQGCVFRRRRVVFGVMENWKPKLVSKPCILDGAHAGKY